MAEPDLSQYDPVFQAAGNEWNVDPTLLKAVAAQESGGRTTAVSPKGAQGLMQITPDTQRYLGVTDPTDPVQSIYGAAKYLSEGLDKEGSPEGALLYYHGGPGWRQAYGPESRAYVPGVTAHYLALKPPDQPQATPAASSPQGPLILGDSLASKGGLGGAGVIGAPPKAVLGNINGLSGDQVQGRDVLLSSGASNDPSQAGLLEQQIKALQDKGAKSVTVVGVGDAPRLAGVNDGLAATAGRFGATFVPLDTTQLGPDRVHPTQQGYRTLLAAATPKTATDTSPAAAPAPAGSQGQGKAMASDDLPSWLPPAPKATSSDGTASTPAATATPTSDTLPSWLPPAPKSSTTATQTPGQDYTTFAGAPPDEFNLSASPSSITLPSSLEDARTRIQQGDINALNYLDRQRPTPLAADSSWLDRLGYTAKEQGLEAAAIGVHGLASLAQLPVNVLIGLSHGAGANALTIDPNANAVRLTPEAVTAGSVVANPLQFSRGAPLVREAPGTLTTPPPVTADELRAAILRANQQPAPPTGPPAAATPTPSPAPAPPSGVWVPAEAGRTYPPGWQTRVNRDTGRPEVLDPTRGAISPNAGQGPQATGAQITPTAVASMTPEEIATQRTVADKQWLNQTQQPGVRDTTEYVPGITPSLVEQEQTVTAARELKALKNLNPELSQAEREILDRNTDLRKGFYADTVGSDVTRAADLKAANDKIESDLQRVWRGKGEADPANVNAQIRTELAGSAGDLPPLKSAMKQVSDSLENAGTDPEAMYRTHRLINYLQSRQGQLENPGYGAADVQAALTRVKGTLAKTIDDAASGFGQAMSDYSTARGPIDAAKALQDRENGLYDSRGHMSFLKVHALMRDIIDAQKWDAPNDPLAGVSDAQMARLKALHDDLKRTASAKDLATAQGSDTAMNAVDIAKAYSKLAGRAGIEGAANIAFGPGVGSMVVRGAENLLRPITSGIAARRQIRRGMEILRPPPSNPLSPP